MKIFENINLFVDHLIDVAAKEVLFAEKGLEICAKLVKDSAVKEIGHLQPAVGPFAAWEELAESTKEDKERLGYHFNGDYNPLLRTGELAASINYNVNPLEAIIGSTSPVMVYQEFGTSKMPPRAVLGPAGYKNKEKIKEILGLAFMSAFIGTMQVHPSLGYNAEI